MIRCCLLGGLFRFVLAFLVLVLLLYQMSAKPSLPGMPDLQGMAGGCSDVQAPRTGLKMSSSRQGALYFPGRAQNPIRQACVLLSEEARAAPEPQLHGKLGGTPPAVAVSL